MRLWVKRGFRSVACTCDANGYFTCSETFKYEFTYNHYFSRDDFELREGSSTSEIVYKKTDQRGSYTRVYENGSKEAFWSVIFRAAYQYYYKSIDIRRPPQNSFWNARLAIQAMPGYNTSVWGLFGVVGRFILSNRPQITVYKQTETETKISEISSEDVFGTISHELAHASHWGMDKDNYIASPAIIYESYARGVQRYLTRKAYPTRNYEPYYWRCSYTAMMRDIIDEHKFVESYYWRSSGWDEAVYQYRSYSDRVQGYTIRELEDALIGCRTWDQWRDKIKSKYPNKADRQYVDEVFSYWNRQ